MTPIIAGRYELTRSLGTGGMGQVWEAFDRQLARSVAVKLLTNDQITARRDRTELVRRFARESTLTAGLHHPGVPTVHDAGSYEGGLYLVMELIEGRTIGDVIDGHGPLSAAWTAAIGAQVCAVLAVAHEAGLAHRDIKPQNLMLTRDGTVKVLDFGVATMRDAAGAARITRTGQAIGTPAYMAPEQLRGEEPTPTTDLYALGCVLYEMLAGRPVFAATSPHAMAYKHLEEEPPPLDRSDLPHGLEWLVRRLLAKDALHRPADARGVYVQLLRFVQPLPPLGDADPGGSELTGIQLQARALAAMSAPAEAPSQAQAQPQAQSQAHAQALPVAFTPPAPAQPPAAGYAPPATFPPQIPHAPTTDRPAAARGIGWKLLHSLWLLPSLAFGFFTWLCFLYIAIRHQSRKWLITSGVYVALASVLGGIAATVPNNSHTALDTAGAILMVLLWFGGTAHCLYANVERLSLRGAMAPAGAGAAGGAITAGRPEPWHPGLQRWPAQPTTADRSNADRSNAGRHGWPQAGL